MLLRWPRKKLPAKLAARVIAVWELCYVLGLLAAVLSKVISLTAYAHTSDGTQDVFVEFVPLSGRHI